MELAKVVVPLDAVQLKARVRRLEVTVVVPILTTLGEDDR